MRALPVIIGIVVVLALVSLPGAAIWSEADLLASYNPSVKADLIASYTLPGSGGSTPAFDIHKFSDPDQFSCCSNDIFRGMNYTSTLTDDGGSSPEPAPPTDPGHAPGSPPPTPIPSLEELIASYSVKPYSDPITCCNDCTPQPWSKGTVTPTSTPVAWTYGDPLDSYTVPVPILPCIGGHCPESLPVTWYNKVAFRILSF